MSCQDQKPMDCKGNDFFAFLVQLVMQLEMALDHDDHTHIKKDHDAIFMWCGMVCIGRLEVCLYVRLYVKSQYQRQSGFSTSFSTHDNILGFVNVECR